MTYAAPSGKLLRVPVIFLVLPLLRQDFRRKKTCYPAIDLAVFLLMLLACAGITHPKEQQIPPRAMQLGVPAVDIK